MGLFGNTGGSQVLRVVVACGALRRYQGHVTWPACRLDVDAYLLVSFGLPMGHSGDTNGIPNREAQLDPEESLPAGRYGRTNGRTPGTSLSST